MERRAPRTSPTAGSAFRIDGGTNNPIGGTTAADRNVIALSKTLIRIQIRPSGTTATVEGNYIGVNTSGGTPFSPTPPVGSSGILINSGSTNNNIGGAVAGAGNVIGGIEAGIKFQDTGTTANRIKGNSIGVGAGGQAVGNRYGIWVVSGPTGNNIGGTIAEGNLVAIQYSRGHLYRRSEYHQQRRRRQYCEEQRRQWCARADRHGDQDHPDADQRQWRW